MSHKLKKCLCVLLSFALIIPSAFVFARADEAADKVSQVNTVEQAMEQLSDGNTAGGYHSHEESASGQWTRKTTCAGDGCAYTPVIIVPGIMQSQVYVTDKDGNDIMTSDGFPIVEGMDMKFMFDMNALIKNLKKSAFGLIMNLLLGRTEKFTDKALKILEDCCESHFFNPDGTRKYGVAVDEYWYSFEEAKNHPDKSYNYAKGYGKDENGNALPTTKYETEYDFLMRQVNISNFASKAGYDHAYYYAYSSFGDTYDIASRLNEYIDMVKAETGHSKVSIVFISLGGTIGNVYLSEFCDPDEIDRIVFAAAAVDGSYLLADIMGANFSFDNKELFYSELFPTLIQLTGDDYVWLGYLANIVLRILPQRIFSGFLMTLCERAVNEVLSNLITNCPSMWALVPSSEYEKLSAKLISDEAHAKLKEKTDRYYEIQKNARSTIRSLCDDGMDIFVVCGYNLSLPATFDCYKYSSDNIIQVQSSSIGATAADLGEKLSADYVPAIDKSYISPEGDIDAGTAALPDRTWFVRNQSHLKLQTAVNDIIELCVQIAVNHDITDSRVNNGGYRQFTYYRDLGLLENMMGVCSRLDEERLNSLGTTAQREELISAYAEAREVYNSRDWSIPAYKAAEQRLYTIMYELGILSNQKKAQSPLFKYKIIPSLEKTLKRLSDLVNKTYGAKDFVPFI